MVETTIGIDGMQCEMCEAHINEAIRKAFPQIKEVRSWRKKKYTRIVSNEVIAEEALRDIVRQTGYTFLSYRSEPYVEQSFLTKIKALFRGRA